MKRLLTIAVACFLALSPAATVRAQSNQATDADVQKAKDTAAAATSTSDLAGTVPGYGGDATDLQGLEGGDFAAIAAQGQSKQGAHDATAPINANQTYQTDNPIDANADWVKNALEVERNPEGTADGAGGTTGEVCTDKTEEIATHSLYTCEEGVVVEDLPQTCTLEYKHNLRYEYVYRCQATWVDGMAGLQPDARCTILQNEPNCKLESTTCDQPSQAQTYSYSCSKGQEYTPSTATCSTNVTSEYQYKCNHNWVDGQPSLVPDNRCNALAASASCTKTGETCVTPAKTETAAYSCFKGVETSGTSRSCSSQFSITNYAYKCSATFSDTTGTLVPDFRCNALSSSGVCTLGSTACTDGSSTETATYACYSGSTEGSSTSSCTTTRSFGSSSTYNYQCDRSEFFDLFASTPGVEQMVYINECVDIKNRFGVLSTTAGCGWIEHNHANDCAGGQVFDGRGYRLFMCNAPYTGVSSVSYQGTINNACGDYRGNGSCTEVAAQCNGMMYGLWCRAKTRTYNCSTPTGSKPPSSTNTTYTDQGEDTSACQALATNPKCTATGTTCAQYVDPAIAASLGYPTSTCVRTEHTYTCASSTPVSYCEGSAPAGPGWSCVSRNECVASGGNPCAVTKTIYECTKNSGVGGCKAEDRVYNCSQEVAGGAPITRVDHVENLDACTAIENDSSCRLTNTTCLEMSSYSTDVLAALGRSAQFCIRTTKDYTCEASTAVDYCDATPVGSGWTCVARPATCVASGSNPCAQQKTTYDCSRTTGVGGCETKELAYSCSAEVPDANPPENVIDSTNSSACQAIASNPACTLTSETCSQWQTKTVWVRKVPQKTTVCVAFARQYTCEGYSPVDSCTGTAPAGSGWTCTPVTECVASGSNTCAITKTTYNCSRQTGSDGCDAQTKQYACSTEVPPANPYQEVRKYQDGGGMVYNPACDAATNDACQKPPAYQCVEGAGTRVIDGVSVHAECWKAQETYTCQTVTGRKSNCEPEPSCTLQETKCISETSPCSTFEKVYSCKATTEQSTKVCRTTYSAGGSSIDVTDDEDNDLGRAAAAMNVMKESSDSYQTAADLKIFGGSDLRCKKAIFGLYNCCKDSGTLVDWNVVNCSADEQKLALQQKNKACRYIGTYCSNKSFFGTCLEKKMTYCCYGSVLARIVQEAGHAQLGKTWGDAKGPSCGGFTVEEFEKIDLSNVDFSDFYADTLSKYGGDQNSTINAITNSLNNMQATKTPTK